MSRLSGPGLSVLRGFIAASNEQYRKAGLGEYQMRVDRNGRVTQPGRPKPAFRAVPGTGSAAADQAAQGAAPQPTPKAGAASATDSSTPQQGTTGPPPTFSSIKPTKDGFAMTWEPMPGAKQYGIWVDGVLVGHVPKPAFAGTLAPGSGGIVQVDAVLADGARSTPTSPLALVRDAKGALSVQDPTKAAPAGATAPAAPAS